MQRAVDRSCNIVCLPYSKSIWIRRVLRTIDGMNEERPDKIPCRGCGRVNVVGAHFINRDAISTSDLQAIACYLSDPDGRHVTPGEVSVCLQLAQNPTVSFDQPIGSNGRTLLDSLQPRAIEENGELDSTIAEAMLSLSEMEQQVLTFRFGLGNQEEQTLEEVGRRFHCSAEWIRKTEKKALTKLRTAVATAASAKPSQQRHWGR